jgi:hypothetical protein
MAPTASPQRLQRAPVAADLNRGASMVQRLAAAGYDWLFDRVDPLGGADHRRRLVEQATGAVLEIGAGPAATCLYTATPPRSWPWSPARDARTRANQAAQAAWCP